MNKTKNLCREEPLEGVLANPGDFKQIANELCEKALVDAKDQLHPLLQSDELENLDHRCEFVQGFKRALEVGVARQLAFWQPCIQAVFEFNNSPIDRESCWDSTIHLLIMVTRPLKTIKTMNNILDKNLVKRLKQLSWPRFQMSKSIIEIHQVTPDEVRLGLSYGAMFASVYNAPVKVWPMRRRMTK